MKLGIKNKKKNYIRPEYLFNGLFTVIFMFLTKMKKMDKKNAEAEIINF